MTEKSSKLFSFVWKIENFSWSNHKNSEYIASPHFIIESLNYSKWYIRLYPKGNVNTESYVSIFLYRDDDSSAKEEIINFKLEAIGDNGTSLHTIEKKNVKFTGMHNGGLGQFISRETLVKEMNNWNKNVITICCDISSEQYGEDESFACGCNALTKIGIHRCSFDWHLNTPHSSAWREKKKCSLLPAPVEITVAAPDDVFKIHIRKGIGFPSVSPLILCRFSLLNDDGKISASKCDSYLFDSSESDIWVFPSFLNNKHLEDGNSDFKRSNMFVLRCEINVSNGTLISGIENYVFQTQPREILTSFDVNMFTSLHDDLRNMFTLKKHCDVQLKLGDNTIPVHKAVLAARSPVFSAMFDQDMQENHTGVVNIDDVETDTMVDLLECIYTGSVKELNYESASKLLIAADKYQIESLKQKCSQFLASILSMTNVCEVLSMAAVMDASLKASAMDYIMNNVEKILSSQTWSDWVKNNHDLTTEVFLTLSKSMQNVIKRE